MLKLGHTHSARQRDHSSACNMEFLNDIPYYRDPVIWNYTSMIHFALGEIIGSIKKKL